MKIYADSQVSAKNMWTNDKPIDPFKDKKSNNIRVYRKWIPNVLLRWNKTTPELDMKFQTIMWWPSFVAQFLGILPVTFICNPDAKMLRFSRKSWRYFYSLGICIAQSVVTLMCVVRMFRVAVSFQTLSFVLFYGPIAYNTYLFMHIAQKWPALMRDVASTELADPITDRHLKSKCTGATIILMSLAVLEHVLSIVARMAKIINCDDSTQAIFILFQEQTYPWLYEVIESRNEFLGIVVQLINVLSTFCWNYADLFIICISLYLTSRLEQINVKLLASKGKYLPEMFWRKMREDYNRITNLVRSFDDTINGVVFVSFANNLFFICFQLFNALSTGIEQGLSFENCQVDKRRERTFTPLMGYENTVYFIFSLLLLLSRSLVLSLIASQVNSASKLPAQALYSVPSPVYCVEVQRFLDQLHGDTVALSGMKFFNVKRSIVLSVAGTIVTYELVLLQFSQDN